MWALLRLAGIAGIAGLVLAVMVSLAPAPPGRATELDDAELLEKVDDGAVRTATIHQASGKIEGNWQAARTTPSRARPAGRPTPTSPASPARRMVLEWGMSARLGHIAWGNDGPVSLGDDLVHTRDYPDRTAGLIDEDVTRIVGEQAARATRLLTERRDALDAVATALLEHETLDAATSSASSGAGGRSGPGEHHLQRARVAGPGEHVVGLLELAEPEAVGHETGRVQLATLHQP